jgi:hypothetical protein
MTTNDIVALLEEPGGEAESREMIRGDDERMPNAKTGCAGTVRASEREEDSQRASRGGVLTGVTRGATRK